VRDHPILARLADSVRSLRKARGWSRRELAERTRISERFLADVEAGSANPSLLRLVELAQALEVTLMQLLDGSQAGAPAKRHVALLGLRGAGKSTVGPRLAARLGKAFVELDSRIEAATGLQLSEMFLVHGEAYYRQAERAALESLLAMDAPCVVAVGGGLVTEPASFAALRSQTTTVWLRADPKDHWQRVLNQGDTRPMADNERAFADLRRILAEREPFYRLSDIVCDTSGRGVDGVVEELAQRIDAAESGRERASAPLDPANR
jgi:XRE family aerobic/anaerobic benzoate catabolism transcriptional regulator